MTFDEKFSRAYRASVEATPHPADLADNILKAVKDQETAGVSPVETSPTASSGTQASHHSPQYSCRNAARPKRAPFWKRPLLAGACAAASLALVAALPALAPILEESPQVESEEITVHRQTCPASVNEEVAEPAAAASSAPIAPGLSVRAYALEGSDASIPEWAQDAESSWGEPFIEGEDEPIALFYPGGASGSGESTMWPEEDGSVTQAAFGSDTFTVEGSNIARIQIRASDGELYLQSVDEDVRGDRAVDLWGLDPRERGTRAGYEDCDALGFFDYTEQDAGGQWHTHENAFRMKRMGNVIDLSKNDDARVGTRDIQFGLLSLATTSAEGKPADWMSDKHFADTLEQPAYLFDGVKLTITATFDDGSCETQVIELHRDQVLADDNGMPVRPIKRYTDVFASSDASCTDLAYGTLVSKTDEPFPYADEAANQYADTVMPPMPPDSEPWSCD